MKAILTACKKAFFSVCLFSILINLFMLTVPLYMLQIFDRVLVSQSTDTLMYLCIIAIFFMVIYACLEFLRGRVMTEVSHWLDKKINHDVLPRLCDFKLQSNRYVFSAESDITRVKQFLKSPFALTFLDMPWFPIYLIVIFILSTTLGFIALIGGVILFTLAYINKRISSHEFSAANSLAAENNLATNDILTHAETIQAMGMGTAFLKNWFHQNNRVLTFQSISSKRVGLISTLSKFLRIIIQILILTIGAYLVIKNQLTGGGMIAASIITGRALAPVEQSISAWKEFFLSLEAFKRLRDFMQLKPLRKTTIDLPKASGALRCEELIYMPTGSTAPLLQNINFSLQPGESLAILGPSGAGKSTLARLILGIWPATRGAIRLDNANVFDWDREHFGEQVGYLPQDNGLLSGTIKQNIACLQKDFKDEDVVYAAQMANAHDMILQLPQGYETPVTDYHLSGGQAKRVALARAFYKNPCLIVLDEPETHLDVAGEKALLQAIKNLQSKHKSTLVIITRHIKIIEMMNKALLLKDGTTQAFDTSQNILSKLKS